VSIQFELEHAITNSDNRRDGRDALQALHVPQNPVLERDYAGLVYHEDYALCFRGVHVMVAIGLLSVAGPARRLLRIDSTEALRESLPRVVPMNGNARISDRRRAPCQDK